MEKRVNVYFNLHKRVWSVRQSGIVIEHTKQIFLRDVKYRVSEKGRERVLRESRKNVHAYASGYICEGQDLPNVPERITSVTYNPYKHKTFVFKDNGKPCLSSDYAEMRIENGKPILDGVWK
tara:strand:- start:214 stop:579 length:366 start_codon:yes stop_codon:yes gene_type:complete